MKKGNSVSSRTAARFFSVVVGFLGLLFVTNGALAQTYTPIFSDEFDREGPAVGNGWEQPEGEDWQITTSGAVSAIKNNWNEVLVRPSAEKFRDGKASITFIPTLDEAYGVVARYHEGAYYNVWFRSTLIVFAKVLNTSQAPNSNYIVISIPADSLPTTSGYVLELVAESLSLTQTKRTANLYDTGGNLTFTHSINDSEPSLQTIGQWGINVYLPYEVDSFISAKSTTETGTLFWVDTNHQFGNDVSITLQATDFNTSQTVTLSDNQGGSFNPTTLTFDEDNEYTATTSYTPTQAGEITITATASNGMTGTVQLFISPYSTTIGFIGDSITVGAGSSNPILNNAAAREFITLGGGFSAVNRGVSASTVQSWLDTLLTGALEDFNASGVEIVQIMLGTNDAALAAVDVETYRSNMIQLTTRLKEAGIKKIILNEPTYAQFTPDVATHLQEYSVALAEVADGETVFVGDTSAYEAFEANSGDWLSDGVHPNDTGYVELGKLRAAAFKRIMDSQTNPNHSFTGINESNHILGTLEALTFRVDKYFEEFNDVVKVDGVVVPTTGYVATSGSTTIELNADYLNTLAAGDHTLTVGFEGGVEVAENFTILPDPTLPPVTPPTIPSSPTYAGGGGGGISLVKDSCPNGDLSPSYYDGTCGTTTNLTEKVAKKVNLLRPIIKLIYLTATEEQKTFVHNLITSCSQTNKNEVIKLACQELVEHRDF